MRDKGYLLPFFIFSLTCVFLIIFLAKIQLLNFVNSSVQSVFFPLGMLWQSGGISKNTNTLDSVKKENADLREQLAAKTQLIADDKALRDQFQVLTPPTRQLLPVKVVGMPSVIPHLSFPETIIINAGENDGITNGLAVIVGNELIGILTKTTLHYGVVQLISSKQSSFSVKVASSAFGVLKGQGNGDMLIDNVLLSDQIKINDSITSVGSQNEFGKGIPPDLVIGKIVSVDKNPTNLFQKARAVPLILFDSLQTVFVLKP